MTVKPDPGGFPQRKSADLPAVSARQMREIQRVAQEDFGLDIMQITENGGRAIATLALAMLGGRGHGQRVVVLAGGGNKGGAGLCAVRNLANWGCNVEPIFGEVESEVSFAARRQLNILRECGIVEPGHEDRSEITLEEHLSGADLVIDALVGYGLEGPPSGIAAALTELAVASKCPILAVDVPTGVNATTGEVSSPAIRACTTLALDLPKKGLFEPGARACVGELYLADLGIPLRVHERLGIALRGVFSEGPIVRIRR
jgi:NAD(P)H-hydrate epimerase